MSTKTLKAAIQKLLYPLIKILLRENIAYSELSSWVKEVYVNVADHEFPLEGKKQTISRISVLTGINRKEVKRLRSHPSTSVSILKKNRSIRVISGWMSDPGFVDVHGQPKVLDIHDSDKGFPLLIKRYSGDIPPKAVLDELLRVGVVEKQNDNQVRLLKKTYIPHQSDTEMLQEMGNSCHDLLETIEYNLTVPTKESRFQMSVAYDNLPMESVNIFRSLSEKQAYELLARLDKFLVTQDRDSNPDSRGCGKYRAGLGIYYFEKKAEL